jgi:hypothetical protein
MNKKVLAVIVMALVFLFPVRIGFLSENLPGLKMIFGMVLTIIGTYGAMILFNIKEKKGA